MNEIERLSDIAQKAEQARMDIIGDVAQAERERDALEERLAYLSSWLGQGGIGEHRTPKAWEDAISEGVERLLHVEMDRRAQAELRAHEWEGKHELAERERNDLRALLAEVEWGGDVQGHACCPMCFAEPRYGHEPDCRLHSAIKETP